MASVPRPLSHRTQSAVAIGAILTPIMLVVILIFNFIPVGVDSDQQRDIKKALFSVRESQYRACVLNGNTLRNQVRREFVDIKRKSLIPTYEGIAATIPEGAPAREILEGQVAYLKQRIRTIRERLPDVHCLAVYPPLPGQVYPEIKPPRQKPENLRPAATGDGAGAGNGGSTSPAASTPQVVAPQTTSPVAPTAPPASDEDEPSTGSTGPRGPQGPAGDDGDTTTTPTTPPPAPDPNAGCVVNVLGIRVCT